MAGWPANAPIDTKRALAGDLETLSQQFWFRHVSAISRHSTGVSVCHLPAKAKFKTDCAGSRGNQYLGFQSLFRSQFGRYDWSLAVKGAGVIVHSGSNHLRCVIAGHGHDQVHEGCGPQRAQRSRMGASCADQGSAASSCAMRRARAALTASRTGGSCTSFDEAHRAQKGIKHFARTALSDPTCIHKHIVA